MHNPGMARNKSSSRPGIQLGIRVTDSEQVDYLYVANREGFETIQKWMLHLADKRARTINNAIESGDYIEVDGKLIPYCDLPPNIEIKKKP